MLLRHSGLGKAGFRRGRRVNYESGLGTGKEFAVAWEPGRQLEVESLTGIGSPGFLPRIKQAGGLILEQYPDARKRFHRVTVRFNGYEGQISTPAITEEAPVKY